jgi:hypothetical protein
VKRHLADDGVLVQWIHAYELDFTLLASIFKALGKHFPDYAVYAWSPGDLYVVASAGGKLPPLRDALFSYPNVASDLGRLGIANLKDLEALRLGGRRLLGPVFAAAPVPANSDYFPVLDQNAPRARFRGDQVFELREMRDALEPVLPLLDAESRTPLARLDAGGRTQPPHVARGLAAREAIAIVEGGAADAALHLGPGARGSALALRAFNTGCEGSQQLWLQALGEVVRAASPHLEARALEPLFARVRASACWKSLDEAGRRRVALLEAINARDAVAMEAHAVALLALEPPVGDRAHYLVSAMTAMLARGDVAGARAIARKYESTFSARDRSRLLVRLLLGQAR